jgi:hypothetical protein
MRRLELVVLVSEEQQLAMAKGLFLQKEYVHTKEIPWSAFFAR